MKAFRRVFGIIWAAFGDGRAAMRFRVSLQREGEGGGTRDLQVLALPVFPPSPNGRFSSLNPYTRRKGFNGI